MNTRAAGAEARRPARVAFGYDTGFSYDVTTVWSGHVSWNTDQKKNHTKFTWIAVTKTCLLLFLTLLA